MKKIIFVVVLALSTLVLAACGGGGEATSNEFSISVADEFSFDPNSITVKAGDTITVTFENTGTVDHNLNFIKPGAELDHLMEEIKEGAGEHIDEELLTDMHSIESDHTEVVTFTAPSEPGEYSYLCTVPGHAEAGLVGTLKVVP
jgi:uncharacterized cupredoxin-like copper-binding protein